MAIYRHAITAIFILALLLTDQLPSWSSEEEKTPQIPEIWTVEEAVDFAIKNNPDTSITRQRIAAARAAVQQADSSFYPQLDLSASYGMTNNPMYSFGNILNQNAFDDTINFNDPGRTDNLNMTATLNYRFYNGGFDEAGLNAAEAAENASQFELEAVHLELSFQVVQSYFTIIQTSETLQARQSETEAISSSLEVARARYEAGDMLKADLLSLEVHQLRAHENLIQARHNLNLARKGFFNLLGHEEGPVTLQTDCRIDQLVPAQTNYDNRPELKKIDAAIEAAESLVRQAHSGYYPTADAFAGYQFDKGYELDNAGNSWIAGVKINYNLFSGHLTSAEIAKANSLLAERKEQKRKMSLAIALEIDQAKLLLDQAGERLQVTQKMVEQAKESARLSRERFKEGVILPSDLIDVENRLTDALVRNTMARTSRRIAVADLRRALGRGQFHDSVDSETSADMESPPVNTKGNE